MTFTLHGLAVSGGIAIGHAYLVSHATLEVAHYSLPPRKVEDDGDVAVNAELDVDEDVGEPGAR